MKIVSFTRFIIVGILTLLCGFVWYFASVNDRTLLTVAFLDIGQGDAIYIEAPNGNQLMIDGGPGNIVLSKLSEVMPFYDRSLDALIVTNPDSDHMAGFIEILKRFSVSEVVEPGTKPTTGIYKTLEETIAEEKVKEIIARRGERFVLDDAHGVYFDVLFPDQNVSSWKTNDGSVIGKLIYGKTCFIFPGDAPQAMELYVVSKDATALHCQVLKVGHHGSRTSTAPAFVAAIDPQYAVISDGRNNTYGHPHKETLETLEAQNVTVLRTDERGTIVLQSDGNQITVK